MSSPQVRECVPLSRLLGSAVAAYVIWNLFCLEICLFQRALFFFYTSSVTLDTCEADVISHSPGAETETRGS